MSIKCWICNKNDADSREHKFKASVIRDIDQDNEGLVYFKGEVTSDLNGDNDPKIKYEKIICSHCNNKVTQAHDKAYDEFTKSIFRLKYPYSFLNFVNFEDVVNVNKIISLKKYFAKILGCEIKKYCIENDKTWVKTLNKLGNFIKDPNLKELEDLSITISINPSFIGINPDFLELLKMNCYWGGLGSLLVANDLEPVEWILSHNLNFLIINLYLTKDARLQELDFSKKRIVHGQFIIDPRFEGAVKLY